MFRGMKESRVFNLTCLSEQVNIKFIMLACEFPLSSLRGQAYERTLPAEVNATCPVVGLHISAA
jgi:hypothetical protein